MIEVEREKTYLAKALPAGLKDCPSELVRDAYVPGSVDHPVLRLRQKGDTYEITKKQPINDADVSRQTEHTIPLTQGEFEALISKDAKSFVKRRYYWQVDGVQAEVDIYLEDLEGLVVIDFEFASDEDMADFQPPAVCLAEVTDEVSIAGGTLAGKRYKDLRPFLERYGYKPINVQEVV